MFRPETELVHIKDVYSYDMILYFKVEDMRQLYKWGDEQPQMEFLAICELASGDFPAC